jgi:serine/threonine-protein kinase
MHFFSKLPVAVLLSALAVGLSPGCGGGGDGGGAGGSGGGSGGAGGGVGGGAGGGTGGGGGGGSTTTYASTVLAGSVTTGTNNGTGAAAQFTQTTALAIASSGNLYVSDNSWIRMITPAGVVTGFAGSATAQGFVDGTGATATFFNPTQMAIDSSGNIFVADSSNAEIRKITTPGAVVTKVAGIGQTNGAANGACASASFNNPQGVAVDASGNIYVADRDNNQIRKIAPSPCTVSLLAGSTTGASGYTEGTGSAARFLHPTALVLDSSGNLYAMDQSGQAIRMITPSGVVSNFAGNPTIHCSVDATGTAAAFCQLIGMTIDANNNIFAIDVSNGQIRKITSGAVVTTLLTSGGASGISPYGMAVNAAGDLFVSWGNLITELKP